MSKKEHASDLLEGVVKEHKADSITLDELKEALHERGFGVLIMIFALPLCLPIPVPPGYTTIFSIPILFFAVQMIFGRDSPWLPNWLSKKQIKRSTLAAIVEKGAPWLRKIEKLLHPRLFIVSSSSAGEKLFGFFVFIFALSIALPLPFTNWPPAVGIVVMSLGLLSRDGIYIIIGTLIGIMGVALTVLILIMGQKAVVALIDALF